MSASQYTFNTTITHNCKARPSKLVLASDGAKLRPSSDDKLRRLRVPKIIDDSFTLVFIKMLENTDEGAPTPLSVSYLSR